MHSPDFSGNTGLLFATLRRGQPVLMQCSGTLTWRMRDQDRGWLKRNVDSGRGVRVQVVGA
jgi:hypothetical protein